MAEGNEGKKPKRWLTITIVVLAILLILAVAAVIALAVAFGLSESDDDSQGGSTGSIAGEETEGDVCQTRDCIEVTNLVLTGLDPTVDPCEDFYNFTCGAWVDNTVIPASKGMHI